MNSEKLLCQREFFSLAGYDGGKDQQAGGNSVVCVEGQTLADILKSVPSSELFLVNTRKYTAA